MKRKQSEEDLGKLMRSRHHFTHKWRDRGYVSCPTCHRQITNCPYCKQSMLLQKAQSYPDFTVSFSWAHIECKEGDESWSIQDFTPVQIQVMNGTPPNSAWVFLTIGTGKAPKGRSAWIIRWNDWKAIQEKLLAEGKKSIRFEATARSTMPIAGEVLKGWELEWIGGGWNIPEGHPFLLAEKGVTAESIGGIHE